MGTSSSDRRSAIEPARKRGLWVRRNASHSAGAGRGGDLPHRARDAHGPIMVAGGAVAAVNKMVPFVKSNLAHAKVTLSPSRLSRHQMLAETVQQRNDAQDHARTAPS